MTFLFLNIAFDYPKPWHFLFQDPATSIMEKIIDLHHDIMFFLIIITALVMWILFRIVQLFSLSPETKVKRFQYLTHNTTIEIVWTIIPAIILFLIALPSYTLIYNLDNLNDPIVSLKIIGHQWYWSYEYPDIYWDLCEKNNQVEFFNINFSQLRNMNIMFDSYMLQEDDIINKGFRLLEVDNIIVLPVETNIRMIITASDVIHSWTIPSLGLKMDATPGRLNQIGLTILRSSIFYGQCSELCGINHAFMPICLKSVSSLLEFEHWLLTKKDWIFDLNKII